MNEAVGKEGAPVRVRGAGRLEEGVGRRVRVTDPRTGELRDVLLCRVDGRLHALDTLCPHEGGRLSEGPLWEGRYAACPLHLYRFDPRDGSAVEVECAPATVLRVEEVGEDAELWLPPPGP